MEPKFVRTNVDATSEMPRVRKKRIGVILPAACRGEWLETAIDQALMLKRGSEAAGEGVEVVVSQATGDPGTVRNLRRLTENGITLRETNWQPISKDELGIAGRYLGVEYELNDPAYVYPSDGARNFLDCDFWYLIADRNAAPLAPMRPYAVFVNDCLQRYVPEISGDRCDAGFIATTRRSAIALCTTPFTCDDLIQYVGLPARKVALAPAVIKPLSLPADPAWSVPTQSRAYFLWLTHLLPHGNHEIALRGIQRYFDHLNGKLDVIVGGVDTDKFDPKAESGDVSAHVRRVRSQLAKSQSLTDRIRWAGTLDHDEYAWILRGAQFLFHPSLIGAASLTAAQAAGCGVPTLSNDYPPMRFYDQNFALGTSFFDGTDEISIASTLRDAENRLTELKQRLPVPADLAQFDLGRSAPSLWNAVRQHV